MEKIQNYIAGEMWHSRQTLITINPATAEPYQEIPDSDVEDLKQAIVAAESAFPAWSALEHEARANYLLVLASELEKNQQELARIESEDNGKPLSLAATLDIPRAIANLRFFAQNAPHWPNETYSTSTAIHLTLREPLGVVACISPWNLPLYLFTWKIAPALITGNCVIAKPSEVCPASAHYLSLLAKKVGFPPGVLNILHGRGGQIGQLLCEAPEIKAISFTGGTKTGAQIAQTAARSFKKVSLELGGKNPTIVFADCDFNSAVSGALRAAFSNQGQICLCGSRILVEEKIYSKFRDVLVAKAKELLVGDPLEASSQQGAVVSKEHMEKILSYVALAQKEGGRILCGGDRIKLKGRCSNGYFISPCLIEGLSPEHRVNQEEIFGPVATLIPFRDENHAIQLANSTRYGLACSIWSRDGNRCQRVARGVHAGLVWVNSWMIRDLRVPFGGMKESGVGREGGRESLAFFTQQKSLCLLDS